MVFLDTRVVFIHIPKTGGTTIEKMLTSGDFGLPARGLGAHHSLQKFYDRFIDIDDEDEDIYNLSEFTIFTVARNPWERYASMYVHDYKAHAESRRRKNKLPDIEEYMKTKVQENFFSNIEINGAIPDNLMIINFDDFVTEVRRIWKAMGIPRVSVPHENSKQKDYYNMQLDIISNNAFQKAVQELCAAEIELFAYEIPQI